MNWIKQHLSKIAMSLSIASLFALIAGGWWLLLPATVLMASGLLIYGVLTPPVKNADNVYWAPPKGLIKKLVPIMFVHLRSKGYGKNDYQPERNDCDDYTLAGMVELHGLLLEDTKDLPAAQNKAFTIHPFSFRRENGRRHRLFFVLDGSGTRHYIENYPVFDKYHDESGMYRILTAKEELNGYTPS